MNFDKLTDEELLATAKTIYTNYQIVSERLSDNKKHSPFEVAILCNVKASYEVDLRKINEEIAKRKLQVAAMGENDNYEDTRF